MLRYRIVCDPNGHYLVLAAPSFVVGVAETYGTRAEAQDTADWLNHLKDKRPQDGPQEVCAV